MPALKNARHEKFAQGVAKGKTQDQAYKDAGYKPHRPSASRLRTNANVAARIEELQAGIVKEAQRELKYDAISIFKRIDDIITSAHEAGDHKVAMEGAKFIAKAFGYEDHPTLTHEHVNKSTVSIDQPEEAGDGDAAPAEDIAPSTNVTRFNDALKKIRVGKK